MELEEKIKKLRRQLLYHAKRYYVDDDPEISDFDLISPPAGGETLRGGRESRESDALSRPRLCG